MRPKIDLPTNEIATRYRAGESTYVLGQALGVSYGTIRRRLLTAGVQMRSRGEAGGFQLGNKYGLGNYKRGGPLHVTGNGYLGTSDRKGKQRTIHRGCWEAHYGKIPDGYVIHHRDKNRQHNEIRNLVCIPAGEHGELHNAGGASK